MHKREVYGKVYDLCQEIAASVGLFTDELVLHTQLESLAKDLLKEIQTLPKPKPCPHPDIFEALDTVHHQKMIICSECGTVTERF